MGYFLNILTGMIVYTIFDVIQLVNQTAYAIIKFIF